MTDDFPTGTHGHPHLPEKPPARSVPDPAERNQQVKRKQPPPRTNSFDDLVLTEFGDFIAQTAAILFEAGFTAEEAADALDPGNIRPHIPIADNGERITFVQCPRCNCRVPGAEELCFNCGEPLHDRNTRDG